MIEAEEIIESRIVALLSAAVPALDVIGALSPVEAGEMKHAALSCISVFVDLASQNLDWQGAGYPCTWSVRILLRVEEADDKTFALFRDSARSIRGALSPLAGDGCEALDFGGFECDAFTLDSTETALDSAGDDAAMTKTYNATVQGRFIPQTPKEEI